MRASRGRVVGSVWSCVVALTCLGVVHGALPTGAAAQTVAMDTAPDSARPTRGDSTVEIAAGAHYEAGWARRVLLGARWRRLWATPIRVPALDLAQFAGGLTATRKSGGMQTRGLKFVAADGRVFKFRSLDKDPSGNFPPQLRHSVIAAIWQDAISALHPGGALAASVVLDAARVPHVSPRLVVLPDSPRLGEFRAEFAGLLGTLEEDPGQVDHGRPFLGFREIVGTDELVEMLNANPRDRVDARAYLAARLVDMLLNDLDRHEGQWDWGRRDAGASGGAGERRIWAPIPGDRDQVFISYHGLLPALGRHADPRLVTFDSSYDLPGLTRSERELDRRLLSGLERPTWDSVAAVLQARITDDVIDAALAQMPSEYRDDSTRAVAGLLRHRRDRLPALAAEYYRQLARVVDVHATDAADVAAIERSADDTVELRLYAADANGAPTGRPYFRRRFDRRETAEIRLYLHGGDDRAVVRGAVRQSIPLRLVGGGGTNTLVDSSRVAARGRWSRLYDAATAPDEVYGPAEPTEEYPERRLVEAALDRRPWVGRGADRRPPPPDHGTAPAPTVRARYDSDVGVALGLGVGIVAYGFRHAPYATRVDFSADYAAGPGRPRVSLALERMREASALFYRVSGRLSGLERFHYYGLGNATPGDLPEGSNDVDLRVTEGAIELGMRLPGGALTVGPVVRYARTAADSGGPVAPPVAAVVGTYGEMGLRLRGVIDTRDVASNPHGGVRLALGGELYPELWDATGAVGAVEAAGSTYLSARLPFAPVLALRAGGRRVWGPYPYFDAATVGGAGTLRGWAQDRFAGDGALWGGAELRLRLFGLPALVPGDVGVHGLADTGRVWHDGELAAGADEWHTAFGGGLWIAPFDRDATLSFTAAHGNEGTAYYLQGGFAF